MLKQHSLCERHMVVAARTAMAEEEITSYAAKIGFWLQQNPDGIMSHPQNPIPYARYDQMARDCMTCSERVLKAESVAWKVCTISKHLLNAMIFVML